MKYLTNYIICKYGSVNVKFLLQQDPIIGGSLLLTYTTGYVAPLLLAASFAGALQVWYSTVP